MNFEQLYSAGDTSNALGIGDSTLRKWCLALERTGYHFIRDEKGNGRLFSDHDIIALKAFRDMTAGRKISLDMASSIITEKYKKASDSTHIATTDTKENADTEGSERSKERHDELVAEIIQLKEYMRYQGEYIQQQQGLILQLSERLDHYAKLMNEKDKLFLQEVEGTKKQLISSSINERQQRITDMITMERVKSQLRKEALELWSQKPESERIKRIGLFRKEEAIGKRSKFIDDYIAENFEARIKIEYDM